MRARPADSAPKTSAFMLSLIIQTSAGSSMPRAPPGMHGDAASQIRSRPSLRYRQSESPARGHLSTMATQVRDSTGLRVSILLRGGPLILLLSPRTIATLQHRCRQIVPWPPVFWPDPEEAGTQRTPLRKRAGVRPTILRRRASVDLP